MTKISQLCLEVMLKKWRVKDGRAEEGWNLAQEPKDTVLSLFYKGLMRSPPGQLGASSLGDEFLAPRTGGKDITVLPNHCSKGGRF